MFRFRTLILVGVGLLAASAAWADDIGYVDCANHSEGIQVFGKPRKSPDVVATLPCGERFTVVVYGFVFSQIQTKDGVVGFVYSNVIAVDRNATSLQQAGTFQSTAARTRVPSNPPAAKANPPAPAPVAAAQVEPAAASSAPAKAAEPATIAAKESAADAALNSSAPAPVAAPASAPAASVSTQTGSLLPTPPQAPATTPVSETNTPAAPSADATPSLPTPAQPQPAAPRPESATSAPATTPSASPAAEPAVTAPQPQPEPAAPAPPQPTAAPEAAAPAMPPPPIKRAERASWETPNAAARRPALFELYGGYAFSRMSSGNGGSYSNMNGGMGSIGLTLRPWLQIVADSTYNYVNSTGVKNVLYGNHFGGRYFYRHPNRWGLTPFVEGLVGGSRADTTYTGPSGYTTSVNCMSYKIGGGLDIHPTRHWEIRVVDADFYRTAFGTNIHQNNYWITTGVILHLFGGGGMR